MVMASIVTLFAASTLATTNCRLLFVDNRGYGDIGRIGNTRVRRPHLDKFAAERMKFTSFHGSRGHVTIAHSSR